MISDLPALKEKLDKDKIVLVLWKCGEVEPYEVVRRLLLLQNVWPIHLQESMYEHFVQGVHTMASHMGGGIYENAEEYLMRVKLAKKKKKKKKKDDDTDSSDSDDEDFSGPENGPVEVPRKTYFQERLNERQRAQERAAREEQGEENNEEDGKTMMNSCHQVGSR